MRLALAPYSLRLARPFRISAGVTTNARVVLARLSHGRAVGHGEAAPSLRVTGETPEGAAALLAGVASAVETFDGADVARLRETVDRAAPGNPAAKAALEIAALDLAGRLAGKPVHALLGLEASSRPTSKTVSLDAPRAMAAEAAEISEEGFRHIKVKLGEPRADEARIRAVRDAVPGAVLRVDANGGWSEHQALSMLPVLEAVGVEILEQPCAAEDLRGMAAVTAKAGMPVVADEPILSVADVARVAASRAATGVNIKLMKCGGPVEAVRIADAARRRGWTVMLGCMVETSCAITAASHLLSLVDHADLDGAALTRNDPFEGARIEEGVIRPPEGAGLGLRERPRARIGWREAAGRGKAGA